MKCERCEGLMLQADLIDMGSLFEPMWSRSWRCLNCGHATDSVMEVNRRQMTLLSAQVEQEKQVLETNQDVLTPLAA